jgi:hypothetical protein
MQVKELLITDFVREPGRRWLWTPPEIPDFAGPGDLARVLWSYRARLAEIKKEVGHAVEAVGDLSDAGLERLLAYAHSASFRTDEGRPVHARLFVAERGTDDSSGSSPVSEVMKHLEAEWRKEWEERVNVHRFRTPLAIDDPRLLSRLAPTLQAEDATLIVREEAGEPVIAGISLLDHTDAQRDLFHMPRLGGHADGLSVSILGPGYLRVAEGRGEYTLWANELFVHQDALWLRPVRSWLYPLSRELLERYRQHPDWDREHLAVAELEFAPEHLVPQVDVSLLWSWVLREALRLKHGGALVIVPDADQAPIDLKFPLQPHDLRNVLAETWLSLCRLWKAITKDDVQRCAEDKRVRTHQLLSTIRSVGALSGTDGCVVLDRNLVLHGFGGSIKANRQGPELRKCIDLETEAEVPRDELLRPFGERHKSAYYLCHEVPGSIAFVISQDGDLRVFASDEGRVYFGNHLHP